MKKTWELKRLYQLSAEELEKLVEELKAEGVEERIRRLSLMALGTLDQSFLPRSLLPSI